MRWHSPPWWQIGSDAEAPRSCSTTCTSAARRQGWFTALRVDPLQGLLGDCEFTPDGAKAITDGVYRFPSPDWSAGSDGRPFCLHTVGVNEHPSHPP